MKKDFHNEIADLSKDEILEKIKEKHWTHSIELTDNLKTIESDLRTNVSPVRKMLSKIDLKGLKCLDIGTRDGGTAFEMEKRGASRVLATDIEQREQFMLAHKYLDSNVEYITDCHVYDLEKKVKEKNEFWDVIILAGVLYHIYDVFGTIAQVRNLLKPGGLLIMETAAIEHQEISMYFNANGYFYNEPFTYWLPTTPCLRYLSRLCCFDILEDLYSSEGSDFQKTTRYSLALRAVRPSEVNEDEWISNRFKPIYGQDYDNLISRPIDYNKLQNESENELTIEYEKVYKPRVFKFGFFGLIRRLIHSLK